MIGKSSTKKRASLPRWVMTVFTLLCTHVLSAAAADFPVSQRSSAYDIYIFLDETGYFERRGTSDGLPAMARDAISSVVSGLFTAGLPASQSRVGVFGFGSKGVSPYRSGAQMSNATSELWRNDLADYAKTINQDAHNPKSARTDFTQVASAIAVKQTSSRNAGRSPIVFVVSDFVQLTADRYRCNADAILQPGDLNSLSNANGTKAADTPLGAFALLRQSGFPGTKLYQTDSLQACFETAVRNRGAENSRAFEEAVRPTPTVLEGIDTLGSTEKRTALATKIRDLLGSTPVTEVCPTLTAVQLLLDNNGTPQLTFTTSLPQNSVAVTATAVKLIYGVDGSLEKPYNIGIFPDAPPGKQSIALTQAEYQALFESGAPRLELTAQITGSGKPCSSIQEQVAINQLPPVVLLSRPTPRVIYTPPPSPAGTGSLVLLDMVAHNLSDLQRTVADVVIASKSDEAVVRLHIPVDGPLVIPRKAADYRLPTITLTLDQLQQLRGITSPRIALQLKGPDPRRFEYADLLLKLPPSLLRITSATLQPPENEQLLIEATVENPGPLPVTVTAAELRLTKDGDLTIPRLPLSVGLDGAAGGTTRQKISLAFAVNDLTSILNSNVGALNLTLYQGDGRPLNIDVDTRTNNTGLKIENNVAVTGLTRDRATLTFTLRNNRIEPKLPAQVIGVRAYPNDDLSSPILLKFDTPVKLNSGTTAKATYVISDAREVNRLIGRIVAFTPVEPRDIDLADIYDVKLAPKVALARLRLEISGVKMLVDPLDGDSGIIGGGKATLSGYVRIQQEVPVRPEFLDDVPLSVDVVNGSDISLMNNGATSTDPIAVGRLRRESNILAPYAFTIKYLQGPAGEELYFSAFDKIGENLRSASLLPTLAWPPDLKPFVNATVAGATNIPAAVGAIPLLGWSAFDAKLKAPKHIYYITLGLALIISILFIITLWKYFAGVRNFDFLPLFQFLISLPSIPQLSMSAIGFIAFALFPALYFIMNTIFIVSSVVAIASICFLFIDHARHRGNEINIEPMEEGRLRAIVKSLAITAIAALSVLVPYFWLLR